ncbi:hypothetical protein F5050DRAFT_159772 [Lentinula boryana]|uniref:GATA-type domain-containing protein n=1 Tax=Lentinula boryana TaxID=40481 RepID=A0ABQ8QCP3_9AGAR|nr:hypothetical protein F5050DRAFT_159772 [Lentinula boryana]
MYRHSRQSDVLLAFDRGRFELTENTYSPRRYSSSSTSSSNYWCYASSSSPYSSSSLGYVPQEPSHAWSNSSTSCIGFSSLPSAIHSYDPSLRSTDLRQQPILRGEVDLWTTSQLSPQWAEPTPSPSPSQSWADLPMPSIEPFETKPNIHHNHHHALNGSCSPLSTLSTVSSSSPSPPPVLDGAPKRGRRPSSSGLPKICYHCHAASTPLWRREPLTLRTLCNACGLYLQQRNKLRPQELIDADAEDEQLENSDEDAEQTGPQCTHCHTRNTSVWRRSKTGAQLCNACGVYVRLRGKDRPLTLKRKKIKPRTKHAKPITGKD